MQYTVKKPINNNILRVVDPTGCELIVTGRGLGFGAKPGYKIEAETVEHSYRMTSPAVQQKLVELLEQIPYEHLLLTDELVAMIRSRVNYPLNESLLITLADHIMAICRLAARSTELAHRFEDGQPIDIKDAMGEKFVCMTESHSVRTIQDRLFERCNFKPNVILETDNMEAAKHVAARANAVMLIPHVYVVNSMELKYRVQCHPIKNNDYERHFFFCYRKGMYLTRYMEDFGRIVCDKLNVPFNMPGHEA